MSTQHQIPSRNYPTGFIQHSHAVKNVEHDIARRPQRPGEASRSQTFHDASGNEFVKFAQQIRSAHQSSVAASPIGIAVLIGFGYQPGVSGFGNGLLVREQAGSHGNSPGRCGFT